MARLPLPNWHTIATASDELNENIHTITEELNHMQNVNTVQILNGLQNLTRAVQGLSRRMDNLAQRVDDRMDVLEITLEEAEDRAREREERSIVRSRNAGLKYHEEIEPILVDGQAPNNFPHTVGQLASLSGQSTNDLLIFYGLPSNGNVTARRHRLARFLGVYLGGTDGVLMIVRSEPDCLHVLVDFEGLGMLRAKRAEGMVVSMINAAANNATIFNKKEQNYLSG